MKDRTWARVIVPLALLASLSACRAYPTRPATWAVNHRPVISGAVVFPDVIGQGDSVLVSVSASDADGDTLRFDWMTDARLRIQGAPSITPTTLFNTSSGSRVFYRTTVTPVSDTAWVTCEVRDTRGAFTYCDVHIPLRN